MHTALAWLLSTTLLIGALPVQAQIPTSTPTATARLRGTITAVEPGMLTVRSREGETLRLAVDAKLAVSVAQAIRFEDIRTGDFVGTTTRRRADGTMEALEVHYLPPTAAAGQLPWDLEPETTMTNAPVSATVSATGARELVLDLKGMPQKIAVPPGIPLVRAVPGTVADLKVGEAVFAIVQRAADGALSVARIQVGRDGVTPPQ